MLTLYLYRTFLLIGLLLSVGQLHAQSLTPHSFQINQSLETTPPGIASSTSIYDTTALDSLLKNPRTATNYSVFGTLFPTALGFFILESGSDNPAAGIIGALSFGFGIIAGPSMGHFYAKNNKKGYIGMLVRLLGAGVSGLGALRLNPPCLGTCGVESDDEDTDAVLMIIGGTALYAGNTVVHWFTADNSARDYNDQVRAKYKIGLAPYLDPATNAKGLTMRVEF